MAGDGKIADQPASAAVASKALWASSLIDITGGVVRGTTQVLVGHPLDTVKVRLQTQHATSQEFKGPINCIVRTVQTEGALALYKGATAPLAGCALYSAALFFAYGQAKSVFQPYNADGSVDPLRNVAAGSATGFAAAFIEGPIDLLKCKMQVQTARGQMVKGEVLYTGTYDVGRTLVRTHGVRGLFQGLGPTIVRNTLGSAAYFTMYEVLSEYFSGGDKTNATVPQTILAGGLAGMIFWTSIFPVDVIKTRMQTDAGQRDKRQYRNILHCFRTIVKHEGWRPLWAGYSTQMIRSFPTNGASWLAFEAMHSYLHRRWAADDDG